MISLTRMSDDGISLKLSSGVKMEKERKEPISSADAKACERKYFKADSALCGDLSTNMIVNIARMLISNLIQVKNHEEVDRTSSGEMKRIKKKEVVHGRSRIKRRMIHIWDMSPIALFSLFF